MTGVEDSAHVGDADIAAHLQRLLASDALAKSATNRRLLSYLVQRYGQGPDGPKESEIAIEVFSRDTSFHGGDDSVVRVAMRGLRQKLLEYYAGQGKDDPVVIDIPKGSYRLKVVRRAEPAALPEPTPVPEAPSEVVPAAHAYIEPPPPRGRLAMAALAVLLVASLVANAVLWRRSADVDPALATVRSSALWRDIVSSDRPVMFVLGDIFMYTQADPVTGRTQTVRDPEISSSEDLRAFLASNPSLASVRGLRYASYLQASTAVALATVLPIVNRPGRRIEIRLREEVRAEDLVQNDIIYVGPLSRMGPLDALVSRASQYRFDAPSSGVTDVASGKAYLPEGELANHRKDYALVSSLTGAQGSRIVIITSGGRGAGLGQVVRTVTTPEGLAALDGKLRESGVAAARPSG
ncbi:winged helix family transcriptional regulator, partial [bacterium]